MIIELRKYQCDGCKGEFYVNCDDNDYPHHCPHCGKKNYEDEDHKQNFRKSSLTIKIDADISYNDVLFDDYVEDYKGGRATGVWTQICQHCVLTRSIPLSALERWKGSGICGVKGCNNESDHYLDFPQGATVLCLNS